MADAILGGNAAHDKPSFPPFNIPKLPGLVDHPLLSPDVQTTVLGLVREQKRVALGALMGALPDHPAPATAVLVLVDAGILQIADGVIDPQSELTLAHANGEAPPCSDAHPQLASEEERELLALPLVTIPASDLQPVIRVVSGSDRSALRKEPLLQRPGIYIGLWEQTAYIGMGKNAGQRASSNGELGGPDPAHRIICITEENDRLTVPQALVAERLFTQVVQQSGEFRLINSLPHGAPIEPEDYDQVRLFVARVALALRQAGLLFIRLPTAALLLPPRKSDFTPLDPDAIIYELAVPDLRAHLAEHDGEWRLLRGSQVRAEVRPSAFGPAAMARAELLHSGGLVRTGECLTTTQDLLFTSEWAASHFVLGQRPRASLWKPLSVAAPSEPDQPRP